MVDLTLLYPPFAAKVGQLIANCKARGAEYKVTSGLRTVAEQDALYALGRTVKNPDGATPAKPLGNQVTKAKGTQSMHNFSCAADFARMINGKAVWGDKDYDVLGEEAAKLGLEWGGGWASFVDRPHVQMKVKLGFLQAAYSKGKLPEVFKYLDTVK